MSELIIIARVLVWIGIAVWVSINYWKEQQSQSKPQIRRNAARSLPKKRPAAPSSPPSPGQTCEISHSPLPQLDVDDIFPSLPSLEPVPVVTPSSVSLPPPSAVKPPPPPPPPPRPMMKLPETEPLSLKDRARLRSQAQRTGKKVSSALPSPPPLSRPATVTPPLPQPEPAPPPPPQLEPEPEPTLSSPAIAIPDYFTPPPKLQVERKHRKPTQFYPHLVRLLGGDEKAADRLVQNLLIAYPDKSERWCYEKALCDLERDRY